MQSRALNPLQCLALLSLVRYVPNMLHEAQRHSQPVMVVLLMLTACKLGKESQLLDRVSLTASGAYLAPRVADLAPLLLSRVLEVARVRLGLVTQVAVLPLHTQYTPSQHCYINPYMSHEKGQNDT